MFWAWGSLLNWKTRDWRCTKAIISTTVRCLPWIRGQEGEVKSEDPCHVNPYLMPWPRITSTHTLDHSLVVLARASGNTAPGYWTYPWKRQSTNSPSLWGMSSGLHTLPLYTATSGLTERALWSLQEPVWLINRRPGLNCKVSQD